MVGQKHLLGHRCNKNRVVKRKLNKEKPEDGESPKGSDEASSMCFRQQADNQLAGQKDNTAMEGEGDTQAGAVLQQLLGPMLALC